MQNKSMDGLEESEIERAEREITELKIDLAAQKARTELAEAACAEKNRVLVHLLDESMRTFMEQSEIGHSDGFYVWGENKAMIERAISNPCGKGYVPAPELDKAYKDYFDMRSALAVTGALLMKYGWVQQFDKEDDKRTLIRPEEVRTCMDLIASKLANACRGKVSS